MSFVEILGTSIDKSFISFVKELLRSFSSFQSPHVFLLISLISLSKCACFIKSVISALVAKFACLIYYQNFLSLIYEIQK